MQQLQLQVIGHDAAIQSLNETSSSLRGDLAQLESTLNAFRASSNEQREQAGLKLDAVKRESRLAEDELRLSIRQIVARLDMQILDRRAMATMLAEVVTVLEAADGETGAVSPVRVQAFDAADGHPAAESEGAT
jgi:hypothetical protein